MAVPEYTGPLERDLRSADRDLKRDRDLTAKWEHGSRPLPNGKNPDLLEQMPGLQNECSASLIRPRKKWSEWRRSHTTKKNHNVNKPESNWDLPAGRMRTAANAKHEVQDASNSHSLVYLLPNPRQTFVRTESSQPHENQEGLPDMLLPLSLFIKTSGRETERLVEKEYEILDDSGQLLKGRKARYNLRHGNDHNSKQDDDGFELL
ncbi:hypothetical protein HJFPF1_03403 [Paramyrothecium foliicola]|nr:hypothetical protein HJFPF1_03403 [Paramyrothecium foliicola]